MKVIMWTRFLNIFLISVFVASCDNFKPDLTEANFVENLLGGKNGAIYFSNVQAIAKVDLFVVDDLRGYIEPEILKKNSKKSKTIAPPKIESFFNSLTENLDTNGSCPSSKIESEIIHVIFYSERDEMLGRFELRKSSDCPNKGFLRASASMREVRDWNAMMMLLDSI